MRRAKTQRHQDTKAQKNLRAFVSWWFGFLRLSEGSLNSLDPQQHRNAQNNGDDQYRQ